jgi:hypothetical protein
VPEKQTASKVGGWDSTMVLQSQADIAAGVGTLASLVASTAVLLDYLPLAAAVCSIFISVAAGAWYAVQLYDRFWNSK